jgi:hypothetical protein
MAVGHSHFLDPCLLQQPFIKSGSILLDPLFNRLRLFSGDQLNITSLLILVRNWALLVNRLEQLKNAVRLPLGKAHARMKASFAAS